MQVRSHQPRITATRRGSTDAPVVALVACLALAATGGYFYYKTKAAQADRFSAVAEALRVDSIGSDDAGNASGIGFAHSI